MPAANADEPSTHQPVWMDVQREGDQVVIAVMAASDRPLSVVVELDIVGASRLHTANRATLGPDRPPVTLSRASIDARKPWVAHLDVTPDGAPPYRIARTDRDESP